MSALPLIVYPFASLSGPNFRALCIASSHAARDATASAAPLAAICRKFRREGFMVMFPELEHPTVGRMPLAANDRDCSPAQGLIAALDSRTAALPVGSSAVR
jgi:hypothetical protein